jgi:hypothetical protein
LTEHADTAAVHERHLGQIDDERCVHTGSTLASRPVSERGSKPSDGRDVDLAG